MLTRPPVKTEVMAKYNLSSNIARKLLLSTLDWIKTNLNISVKGVHSDRAVTF